jgi:hypothetical protein
MSRLERQGALTRACYIAYFHVHACIAWHGVHARASETGLGRRHHHCFPALVIHPAETHHSCRSMQHHWYRPAIQRRDVHSFRTRLASESSFALTATTRIWLACQSSRRTRRRSCAPARMCCISPAETSRIILAQCIKRLGEWMHYPSHRSPDCPLPSIGQPCRFPIPPRNSTHPMGYGAGKPQFLCEGSGRKVNATLGSPRSERLY